MTRIILLLTFNSLALGLHAQTLTMESAVSLALEKHPSMTAAQAETSRQSALRRAAIDLPKTELSLMRGQFNSIVTDENITISQTIPFPGTIVRQRKLATEMVASARIAEQVAKNELAHRVKQTFNHLAYLQARRSVLQKQDSLFSELLRVATIQYKTGETTLLAKTMAETQRLEIGNELERNQNEIESARYALRLLCRTDFSGISGTLEGLIPDPGDLQMTERNPSQRLMEQQVKIAEQEKKLEVSRALPEIKIGYFNQTLIGTQNVNGQEIYFGRSKRFDGFQLGISVPLWFWSYGARAKAFSYYGNVARNQAEANDLEVAQRFNQALQELEKNRRSLRYYRESALKAAALLRQQTETAFRNGEIDYEAMLLNMRQALAIEEGYLNVLYQHNQNLIAIQYIRGAD